MKPLRQFDLNLLILFEALISEGHVSRAADKVFLSQSAMSHALNRLREQLDDSLLVRTEHGLQATPRARAMLPEVRKALQLIEHTLTPPLPFEPDSSEHTFRIACTDYFETVVFPDWFSQLQQKAPRIRIEIDLIASESIHSRIETGNIDLIVGMDEEQPLPKHLLREHWLLEKQVCVAAQDNQRVTEQLSLEQYLQQQHILFFDLEGETGSNIDRWLDEQGLSRTYTSRTTNYMAAARIISNTDAIVTLPYHMARLFCELLPLRMVKPPTGIPATGMTLVQHPLYADDPGIIWLKQSIQEAGQQLIEG